ncbi:AraC family transcriptional regulator [Salmonirosea aquatica]|uniref:Helix-turn-helix domain-containing protein n=1 Tax=Salmonirosea aquatica TaxID=2654236 RepID=A0A7C9FX03_9BACT|nr:helix-turn-helix domain-containing protein [Cytophagaceae bacterium SJW1-29]
MATQLVIKTKIETERTIKVAPFRKNVRRTNPHKHNSYLELIYLSEGTGMHGIDSMEYPIEPPVIHIVRQEQVHYWQLDSEPEGYVVLVKKAFIEKSLDGELKSLFTKISGQSCLQVRENAMIEGTLALMTEEIGVHGENSFTVIEGLLKALLAKILLVSSPFVKQQERKAGTAQAFIQLLHDDNGLKHTVSHYAEILNVSPQNLNMACQRAIGKAAADLMAEFVIAESKRLLLYTDLTVSEIAFSLNFTDPSYFVKYFKKYVGPTPQAFRSGTG